LFFNAKPPQIGQVNDFIFVGSQDVAADEASLAIHGISAILNVAAGVAKPAFAGSTPVAIAFSCY
jgi:hypothetical protein